MPALVDELRALDGTRNPTDGPAIHHPPTFDSKAPCDEDTIHLLNCREDDPWGGLARLQSISRIIWQHLGDTGHAQHPQPHESSWAAETQWLDRAWTDAVETMPAKDYVTATTRLDALYHDLAAAIGLKPKGSITCASCGDKYHPVSIANGMIAYYRCAGCGDTVNHLAKLDDLANTKLFNLRGIAAAIDKPEATVRQWAHRGVITPAGRHHGRNVYNLEEVRRRILMLAP